MSKQHDLSGEPYAVSLDRLRQPDPPKELGEVFPEGVRQTLSNLACTVSENEDVHGSSARADQYTVRWVGKDDPGDPLNTPTWRKWVITIILAVATACVTSTSSISASTYGQMGPEFGASTIVCTLTVSLYVIGIGTGPQFLGRSPVLNYSFVGFFAFNFGVAFAPNITAELIFRFLTGFCGSAFSSVSGGSVSDVFPNHKVGTPMMIWSAMPFFGPVLGPLIGGFINHNTYWRWTYYTVIIWAGVMTMLLLLFVPETYDPVLLKKRAQRKRKETGDDRYRAPIELLNRSFRQALKLSLKTPFILLTTQYMVLFLDTWTATISGILYLSFGGVPYIFREQYGFNLQQIGLAFMGIGGGALFAMFMQPFFQRHYRKVVAAHNGTAPPEARLFMGKFGAICCPLGLILFGLTSFRSVPWIIPILCSSFFGMGIVFSYTATLTYLVDAYRPVAASALASNSFMRNMTAASFPLFGIQLYERLGSVGGTTLLGGLMVLFIPVPFVFHRYGENIRAKSQVAVV